MAKKHIAKKAKWSNKQIFLRIILPILIVAVLTSLGFLLLKLLLKFNLFLPTDWFGFQFLTLVKTKKAL